MGSNGGGKWPKDFGQGSFRAEDGSLRRMLVQMKLNLTDAEAECIHGKLPLDRVQTCGCWPPEAREALAQRQQDNPDYSDAA